MTGKIMKGIAGFYYVNVGGGRVYECKAKGIFRKRKVQPLVGDDVEIEPIDEAELTGNIVEIYPRKNELIRPKVSNVDQALVIFAATEPAPNFNLLDRFLIIMEKQGVEARICFNKRDIAGEEDLRTFQETYGTIGYPLVFTSAVDSAGTGKLREMLRGRTTVVAGPSGVGKSSLINLLQPLADAKTGEISHKIARGRHTTRHTELIFIEEGTYIMDTPGFSSLYITDFEKEELKELFREFREHAGGCRFQGCAHINEPGCRVKEALEAGEISRIRYEDYVALYEELSAVKRY